MEIVNKMGFSSLISDQIAIALLHLDHKTQLIKATNIIYKDSTL